MKEEIKEKMKILIGLKLQYAGRASNLFWLGFGDKVLVKRKRGNELLAEHSLHIQCTWRITKANKILVASRDFYYPRSNWEEEDKEFDWDVHGDNRFDEKINNFLQDVNGALFVERIDSDEIGGLKLYLSESYALEVFPDNSGDNETDEFNEFWRFFNIKDKSPHFIVGGNGIE